MVVPERQRVTNMFMGEYNHTVDAKGRLIVPSKFREQLGDEFVVTKGFDSCLFVYGNPEWAEMEKKLTALPVTNASARKLSRILIPSVLRDYAGIEKEAVLVGTGSHLEIWSKERWLAINSYDDIEDIAESMEGFGI